VGVFSSPKNDRQLTSFHQQSTTHSPSKNHVLYPVFAKTPSKNAGYPRQKKYCKNDKQKSHGLRRCYAGGVISTDCLGGCNVPWVLVDVFAAGGDDAEDRDVDVADGWNDEGVLDADAVGQVTFGEGKEGAADDGGYHEA
jgi:hypothetical protein